MFLFGITANTGLIVQNKEQNVKLMSNVCYNNLYIKEVRRLCCRPVSKVYTNLSKLYQVKRVLILRRLLSDGNNNTVYNTFTCNIAVFSAAGIRRISNCQTHHPSQLQQHATWLATVAKDALSLLESSDGRSTVGLLDTAVQSYQ